MATERNKAYQFFKQHAGYRVGHCAEGALALARTEEWAAQEHMKDEWVPDESGDIGDHDEWCGRKNCEHYVYGLIAKLPTGEQASLWGIIDPDETYMRVVRAELALELFQEHKARFEGLQVPA